MSATKKELREALLKSNQCLLDMLRVYAPEFCGDQHVIETRERVKESGGVLAYITDRRTENLKLLLKP